MLKGVPEEDKRRIEDITECVRKFSRPGAKLTMVVNLEQTYNLIYSLDYRGLDLLDFRKMAPEYVARVFFRHCLDTLCVTIYKMGRDAFSLSKLPEEDKERLRNIANDLAKHISGHSKVIEVDDTHTENYIFWILTTGTYRDTFNQLSKDLEEQGVKVFPFTHHCRVSVPRAGDPLLVVVDIYYNALQELTFLCLDAAGLHVNKTHLPKDVCVLGTKGLIFVQNIRRVAGGFTTDECLFLAPLERNWTFTYRSGALCFDKPCDRMTDAQHKSSMLAWITRLEERDTERALAHLMDTQQYQAADVMVKTWFNN